MNPDIIVDQPSRNVLAELGLTPQQRSAEIVAGLRAVTFPSSEAEVLSSAFGRLFARFLADLSGSEAINNATGGRHICITRLAEQILSEKSKPGRIVELGCGFSGRGLQLARAFPASQVIEVDLPAVIAAKQERVRSAAGERVPGNLSWLPADLNQIAITGLFGRGSVDLLICEGMLPYFTPHAIGAIAGAVRESLAPSGVFIGDAVNSLGWRNVEDTTRLGAWIFHRQAGKFKGQFDSPETLSALFRQAGYAEVTTAHLLALAQAFLPGKPVADVSFILVARKG